MGVFIFLSHLLERTEEGCFCFSLRDRWLMKNDRIEEITHDIADIGSENLKNGFSRISESKLIIEGPFSPATTRSLLDFHGRPLNTTLSFQLSKSYPVHPPSFSSRLSCSLCTVGSCPTSATSIMALTTVSVPLPKWPSARMCKRRFLRSGRLLSAA